MEKYPDCWGNGSRDLYAQTHSFHGHEPVGSRRFRNIPDEEMVIVQCWVVCSYFCTSFNSIHTGIIRKAKLFELFPDILKVPFDFNVIVIGQNSVDEGGCHFPGQMAGIMKLFCGFSQRLNL